MELEVIVLSEMSLSQTNIPCVLFLCGTKKGTKHGNTGGGGVDQRDMGIHGQRILSKHIPCMYENVTVQIMILYN